jgi:hypothetical protein
MQKTTLSFAILTSVLVIIFLMQPLAQVTVIKANFYPFGIPTVELHSPQTAPYIYLTPNVDISFDYNLQKNLTQVSSFSYSLDKSPNSTLTSTESNLFSDYNRYSVFKTLETLANGNRTLTVYAYFTDKTVSSIIDITITVDITYIPPKPIMISPLNQTTYNTKEVPLIYTMNSKIFESYYSLDTANYAIGRIDFTGNTTLTNLSEGSHKLRLSLRTESHTLTAYEYFFVTVNFTIDTIKPTPTPTPSVPEFSWLVILPLFLSMLSIAIIVGVRKSRNVTRH